MRPESQSDFLRASAWLRSFIPHAEEHSRSILQFGSPGLLRIEELAPLGHVPCNWLLRHNRNAGFGRGYPLFRVGVARIPANGHRSMSSKLSVVSHTGLDAVAGSKCSETGSQRYRSTSCLFESSQESRIPIDLIAQTKSGSGKSRRQVTTPMPKIL